MDDSPLEFLLNTDCSISLQCPVTYVILTTALVANDGNHIIIIKAIQVNRVTRQSEGNTGKYTAGGNVRDVDRVNPHAASGGYHKITLCT
jgi:hypothetical protein